MNQQQVQSQAQDFSLGLAQMTNEVKHLVRRVDSLEEEQKEMQDGLNAHEKECARRWARMEAQMRSVIWGLRAVATGLIALVCEFLVESIV